MSDMRKAIEAAAEGIYMMSPWRKNTYDNQTYSWADIAEDHETFIEEATAAIDAAAPILAEAHEPRTITTDEALRELKVIGTLLRDTEGRVIERVETLPGHLRWYWLSNSIVNSVWPSLPATVLYEPAQ